MSTRGAWGFKYKGIYKVTYNHSDSYPDGLGEVICNFVANHTVSELREMAQKLKLVNDNKKPTAKQKQKLQKWADSTGIKIANTDVGGPDAAGTWYQLLRGAQSAPEMYATGLPFMIDEHEFLYDSLFCEYAYIIDLDDEVLRFYTGYNKNNRAAGPFATKQAAGQRDEYYGVAERGSWALTTDAITLLNNMLAIDNEEVAAQIPQSFQEEVDLPSNVVAYRNN